VTSVGSRGDSYDAMAESIIRLYRTELISIRGPWRTFADVELATWPGCTGETTRLHSAIGDIPPVELEAAHYAQPQLATPAGVHETEPPTDSGQFTVRRTRG
jgi:putative transposase